MSTDLETQVKRLTDELKWANLVIREAEAAQTEYGVVNGDLAQGTHQIGKERDTARANLSLVTPLLERATHFVLPQGSLQNGLQTMVKDAAYFKHQGGLFQDWGRAWVPVVADGLNHARLLGWFIGSRTQHPTSIAFIPPSSSTVGDLLGGG